MNTIIKCDKRFFIERCIERGYTVKESSGCIIKKHDNGEWEIDTNHPSYPKTHKPQALSGPGSQLKLLLSKIGIRASANCSCNARAQKMDIMEKEEPGWCENNIDTIVGWLREEAEKRGLPFIEIIAKGIVKLAIKRAKKNVK